MLITGIERDIELAELKAKLLGSFLYFLRFFYKLYTGRDFIIFPTDGIESHYITISRHLKKAFLLEILRLYINIPPGCGKSTLLSYFVAWAYAHYGDCNFIYTSAVHDVASMHTATIKGVMQLKYYEELFGVRIAKDCSAKDNFRTIQGGTVKALGIGGAITGLNAGFPGSNRFTGCLLIDDIHKAKEGDVHQTSTRNSVIEDYKSTLQNRPRGPNVPIIAIGQRLHEEDFFNFIQSGEEGSKWHGIILPAEDSCGNILCPDLIPKSKIEEQKKYNKYNFAAQYQQNPLPAGGCLYERNDFYIMESDPNILVSYITVDTAETDKDYNDSTVFSFFGLYKIADSVIEIDNQFGLHWLGCSEIKVEPADLESNFLQFYRNCLLYPVKPKFIAIEKKSTGVTLSSVLSKIRGLEVLDIERTKASGNKTARFLEIQPYIKRKLISFTRTASHVETCIKHCIKITANNSHAHDDIADTLYDGIRLGLIEPFLSTQFTNNDADKEIMNQYSRNLNFINRDRSQIEFNKF